MAEHAAALQAQHLAMGMAAQPMMAAPTPWAPAGMYAPAPAGTTEAPMNYQQRFGAGATGYQQYGAGGIDAAAAAAGAEQPNGFRRPPSGHRKGRMAMLK